MDSVGDPSLLSRRLIPDLPTTAEVVPYLQRIDQNRWYSNFGPLVMEFEERIKSMLTTWPSESTETAISVTTVASGYAALEIALRLLVPQGSGNVLLPAVTFGACPLAVQHAGLQPVLTDIDADHWTLTPQIARAAASQMNVSAVMPVAIYGVPVPTDEWDEFSADTGIPVIIDAAAAFEVQIPLKYGLTAYSLHATKPFGIGEGGILAGRDHALIEKARAYSNFGMVNHMCHLDGSNAKMSEYHAAIGLAQIDRWSHIKRARAELLASYSKSLEELAPYLSTQPAISSAVVSSLMLLLPPALAGGMIEQAISTGIAFHQSYLPPLYRHPNFASLPVVSCEGTVLLPDVSAASKRGHMRNSEKLLQRLVGVPFHPFMREEDVASVAHCLISYLDRGVSSAARSNS